LAIALEGTLGNLFVLPNPGAAVTIAGDFPGLQQLRIDLTNASLAGNLPPRPQGVGQRAGQITALAMALEAHPVRYQAAAIDVALSATDVQFSFDRDSTGKPLLVLTDAAAGSAAVSISKKDLETAALAAARQAAQAHGIMIEDLKLTLISRGERSLDVDALLKIRKGFSGSFRVKAHAEVDDQLTATLSGLSATGVDMVGRIAATIVQTKLAPFEGKQVPLAAFSLGDVKLRDVKVSVGETVQITAAFGRT
jgi:hypothetical protein